VTVRDELNSTAHSLLPRELSGNFFGYAPLDLALGFKLKSISKTSDYWKYRSGRPYAHVYPHELLNRNGLKCGTLLQVHFFDASATGYAFDAYELRVDGKGNLSDSFGRILDLMDDTESVQAWLKGGFLSLKAQPTFEAFARVSASFVLYLSFLHWCISDRPENPWDGASTIPRSIEDVQNVLLRLSSGINQSLLTLLQGGLGSNVYFRPLDARLKESVASASAKGNSYVDMGLWLHFGRIAGVLIDGWVESAIRSATNLAYQLRDGHSIGLVEKTLAKLSGYTTYAS
jgi:hypothetical protein